MKWSKTVKLASIAFLSIALTAPMIWTSSESSPLSARVDVASAGSLDDPYQVHVTVNPDTTIGINFLSLGFQLSYGSLGTFQQFADLRELAEAASFKIVRVNDILKSQWIPTLMPCTQFNEETRTGTYDWTSVDDIIGKILGIHAEPLICLGAFGKGGPMIPLGMMIDPATNLPKPESYAAYASEWVKHFRTKGWSVRYYEIFNEPWAYFGWEPVNFTELNNYMFLFNAAATSMRRESPDLVISFDFICRKPVMDYWLSHGGADVDSLNFHKYDAWVVGQHADAEMFASAESEYFGTWPLGQSIVEARQRWFNARGRNLPLICSESNFNAAFENGTDPKIQQMAGAVWLAMVLRKEVLDGVSYHTYFELSTGYYKNSYGFGMINCAGTDSFAPWYPYYVQQMLGNNLAPRDALVETTCSSEDVETLGWLHNRTFNLLLISKTDKVAMVNVHGLGKSPVSIFKLDNTIPWQGAAIQSGIIDSITHARALPLVMSGYTVVLLQTPLLL
jgi:hypothetical protein